MTQQKENANIKNVITVFLIAGVFLAASVTAEARRMDKREGRQESRIRQGVKSGELTRGETKRLIKGQAKVHRMEHKAEVDGTITAEEKVRIEQAQDHQSKKIFRAKHNDRDSSSGEGSAGNP